MHLEGLGLEDWGRPERWAAESCLEVVAGSTLVALPEPPVKNMSNSIPLMAKGGKVSSGMTTDLLVRLLKTRGALMMGEAGAAGEVRDC